MGWGVGVGGVRNEEFNAVLYFKGTTRFSIAGWKYDGDVDS